MKKSLPVTLTQVTMFAYNTVIHLVISIAEVAEAIPNTFKHIQQVTILWKMIKEFEVE